MKVEHCENCDATIGRFEQALVYKRQVVCAKCHDRLKAIDKPAQIIDNPGESEEPQLIEKTSKKYKGWIAAGLIMMLLGFSPVCQCVPIEDMPTAAPWLFCGGLVIFVVAKWGAWWHHG